MTVLSKRTYKLLKHINRRNVSKRELLQKYGDISDSRISELLQLNYIKIVSEINSWQEPIEPIVYAITDEGEIYLENHTDLKRAEKFTDWKNNILIPIIVSIITSLLINGIELLLSQM